MRKLSDHTDHRVCLILALLRLMNGLALPGYSWSQSHVLSLTMPHLPADANFSA